MLKHKDRLDFYPSIMLRQAHVIDHTLASYSETSFATLYSYYSRHAQAVKLRVPDLVFEQSCRVCLSSGVALGLDSSTVLGLN